MSLSYLQKLDILQICLLEILNEIVYIHSFLFVCLDADCLVSVESDFGRVQRKEKLGNLLETLMNSDSEVTTC